ncbi:MAG: DUF1566 domain-containing protein [bacterium]
MPNCVPDFSTCVENPAYSSPFFTTSQSDCYDNSGMIVCPNVGEPFYGQEPQFDYTEQDFTVETDVVLENVSGFIWQSELPDTYEGCSESYPVGSMCTYEEARDYCANLELGGYGKWRIPTLAQFISIMNFAKPAPLIFDYFPFLSNDYFLISGSEKTTIAVWMSTGMSSSALSGKVVCVSDPGGMSPKGSLLKTDNIFKADNLFINIIDPEIPKTVFWQYDNAQSAVSWEEALGYCSNIEENGVSGFRLPTVTELQFFASKSSEHIETGVFWTSTTVHATPSNSYTIDFATGNIGMATKTGNNFVICVK